MPLENNVGFCEETIHKNQQVRLLIKTNLDMWEAIIKNKKWNPRTYTYFDITAGPGLHETYGKGSPVIFLEESANRDISILAHFFEIEDVNYHRLNNHLNKNFQERPYFTWKGDHNKLLQGWIENKKPNTVPGLLYCDPSGNIPPFSLLDSFSRVWGAIDILVYLSATNIKRVKNRTPLFDLIGKIQKKRCMIRKPIDQHQWTFLYLTNGPLPEWKRAGFYDLNSEDGKRIFEILNYTEDERSKQLPLFDLPRIS